MAVDIPKCACGCGRVPSRTAKVGPAPLYASAACRVRAYRRRQQAHELEPIPELQPQAVRIAGANTDDQVARSVLEARSVGFALQRLGTMARPDLAWRCSKLGKAIVSAVADSFPETER